MRIGHGYDVHRFIKGDHIVIGGVRIPYSLTLLAHSDGDVLLHAICDALLGAVALGDIGKHFPDTDNQFENADSTVLLAHCYGLVQEQGFELANIDATIVAQAPKMAEYIHSMCRRIAGVIDVSVEQVNVKATTTEELGPMGRGEGIAAHAVVLLTSITS